MVSTAPLEDSRPGPHPEPSSDLATRSLPLRTIPAGERWARIHRLRYDPLYFGRTGDYRFDDPAGEYGVLYVGRDVPCAFIETFGQRSAAASAHNARRRVLTTAGLAARGLALIEFRRPLRLVDVTGPGLHLIGADGRLTTGDYRIAQRWSRALWQHPRQPDGILYRSRHDPEQICAAIYERAREAVQAHQLGSLSGAAAVPLLAPSLDLYGYVVIDSDAQVDAKQ
jgi:hypothetical protein